MATDPGAVMLRTIDKVEQYQDAFIDDLNSTMLKLQSRVQKYLREKVAQSEVVDAALAAEDLQLILEETGYYQAGQDFLTTGYQDILDRAVDYYQATYKESLQYSEVGVQQLEALRSLDWSDYEAIGTDLARTLARATTELQFGAATADEAIRQIAVDLTDQARRYAETWVRTASSTVHRKATELLGEELGITRYQYYGPDDGITRDFCKEQLGKIKKLEEWQGMVNDFGQSVATFCGGWNCRHRLVPVGPAP